MTLSLPDDLPDPPNDTPDDRMASLYEIDNSEDITVTSWEAEFLETVFTQPFALTAKQIVIADRMIDQYL